MKKIIAIITISLITKISYSQGNIIGGVPIDISTIPWQVSLQDMANNNSHFCGGSIINERWILTAAHCITLGHTNPSLIIVHAGSTDQTNNTIGQRIVCDSVFVHPQFNLSNSFDNDIALLHLSAPLQTNVNVQVVPYATTCNTTDAMQAPGQLAALTGWGLTCNTCGVSSILRRIDVPIITAANAMAIQLNNNPSNNAAISNNMIPFFQLGTGAAPGDSGGPATIWDANGQPIVIGITSWGYAPKDQNPTVYTRVRNYTAWIQSHVAINNNFTISGQSTVCQGVSSASYTVVGNLLCNTITWTTNVPQATVSPSTGATTTLSTNGYTGAVTLTASITNSTGATQQIIKAITILSGPPQIGGSYTNAFDGSNNPLGFYPYVTNPACTGYYITTNIQPGGTATWQKISSSDVVLWNQNGNNISFYLSTPNQNAVFQLTYVMPCGTDVKQFKWQSSNCGTGPGGCNTFSVSPNPSNGKVIVIVPNKPAPCNFSKTTSSLDNKNLNIAAINVYNISGNIVRQIKTGITKQASVDLSGLTNGSYYLETISTDGYREKQLVILQK